MNFIRLPILFCQNIARPPCGQLPSLIIVEQYFPEHGFRLALVAPDGQTCGDPLDLPLAVGIIKIDHEIETSIFLLDRPCSFHHKPPLGQQACCPLLPPQHTTSSGGFIPHHWHFSHPVFVMTGLRVTEVPFVKYRTIELFCFQRTEFYRKSSEFKASEKLSLYLRAIENGQNTTASPKVNKKVTIGTYKKRRLDFSSLPKVCINNFCSESSQAYPQT